jgi:predicted DNA-binding protein with PD1-like motif
MDYTEASLGRIFILRLHQDDVLHQEIEKFAAEKQIKHALCFFLGGADDQSKLVVGPKDGKAAPPDPMVTLLKGTHEAFGVGTIFATEEGAPMLHMHGSFGRNGDAVTGCVRKGVNVWLIGEVVILELTSCQARRLKDRVSGFEVLETF